MVDGCCRARGMQNLWAIGDCALVPLPAKDGQKPSYAPRTAQHAIREAVVCADNIVADLTNGPQRLFRFPGLGSMGSFGRRRGIAQIKGLQIRGFPAWLLWRAVYWSKMPGFDRKARVAASWFLNTFLKRDLVQLRIDMGSAVVFEHFEPGEKIFEQGDLGNRVYVIVSGRAEVWQTPPPSDGGSERLLTDLGQGEFFGEVALLECTVRTATIKCVEAMDVLSIDRSAFTALVNHIDDFKKMFMQTAQDRLRRNMETSTSR